MDPSNLTLTTLITIALDRPINEGREVEELAGLGFPRSSSAVPRYRNIAPGPPPPPLPHLAIIRPIVLLHSSPPSTAARSIIIRPRASPRSRSRPRPRSTPRPTSQARRRGRPRVQIPSLPQNLQAQPQPLPDTNGTEQLFCTVCGDTAKGRHFGVIACQGCKGFFKRHVRVDQPLYVCQNDGACEVTYQSRNCCQFCRLKKCVQVGMRANGKCITYSDHDEVNAELMEIVGLSQMPRPPPPPIPIITPLDDSSQRLRINRVDGVEEGMNRGVGTSGIVRSPTAERPEVEIIHDDREMQRKRNYCHCDTIGKRKRRMNPRLRETCSNYDHSSVSETTTNLSYRDGMGTPLSHVTVDYRINPYDTLASVTMMSYPDPVAVLEVGMDDIGRNGNSNGNMPMPLYEDISDAEETNENGSADSGTKDKQKIRDLELTVSRKDIAEWNTTLVGALTSMTQESPPTPPPEVEEEIQDTTTPTPSSESAVSSPPLSVNNPEPEHSDDGSSELTSCDNEGRVEVESVHLGLGTISNHELFGVLSSCEKESYYLNSVRSAKPYLLETAIGISYSVWNWLKTEVPAYESLSSESKIRLIQSSWRDLFVITFVEIKSTALISKYLAALRREGIRNKDEGFMISLNHFFEVVDAIDKLGLLSLEIMYLKILALFSPDPGTVEGAGDHTSNVRDHIMIQLREYDVKAFGVHAPDRFLKILCLLPKMREISSDIIRQIFSFTLDWAVAVP